MPFCDTHISHMEFRDWIKWHAAGGTASVPSRADADDTTCGVMPPSNPCSSDVQRSADVPASTVPASVRSSTAGEVPPAGEVRCERIAHGDCR